MPHHPLSPNERIDLQLESIFQTFHPVVREKNLTSTPGDTQKEREVRWGRFLWGTHPSFRLFCRFMCFTRMVMTKATTDDEIEVELLSVFLLCIQTKSWWVHFWVFLQKKEVCLFHVTFTGAAQRKTAKNALREQEISASSLLGGVVETERDGPCCPGIWGDRERSLPQGVSLFACFVFQRFFFLLLLSSLCCAGVHHKGSGASRSIAGRTDIALLTRP